MYQLIFVMETTTSAKTDWMYIKKTIDFYYKPRSFSLEKVFSRTKPELIKQDKKINKIISNSVRKSIVFICADYDRDEEINNLIIKYCNDNNYNLIWMNLDIEDVYLGKQVSDKNKLKEAINFQRKSESILKELNNLDCKNPLIKRHSSNILFVLDKYIERI